MARTKPIKHGKFTPASQLKDPLGSARKGLARYGIKTSIGGDLTISPKAMSALMKDINADITQRDLGIASSFIVSRGLSTLQRLSGAIDEQTSKLVASDMTDKWGYLMKSIDTLLQAESAGRYTPSDVRRMNTLSSQIARIESGLAGKSEFWGSKNMEITLTSILSHTKEFKGDLTADELHEILDLAKKCGIESLDYLAREYDTFLQVHTASDHLSTAINELATEVKLELDEVNDKQNLTDPERFEDLEELYTLLQNAGIIK